LVADAIREHFRAQRFLRRLKEGFRRAEEKEKASFLLGKKDGHEVK